VDRIHDLFDGNVAAENQPGVQAHLAAVVIWIKIAEGTGITTSMLVVALIWHNKGECRHRPMGKISKEALLAVERDGVCKVAFLNAFEIDKGVMLRRVELDDISLGQRRIKGRQNFAEIRVESWLRLSEQFPANDKWRSAGFRLLGGTGCWV
jgi:hypothetical protein